MSIMGVVLWLADRLARSQRDMSNLGMRDALLIGLSQALAIVPGVSRSGATITMARALGIEREDAANFSFLMATPIIAGAGMLETRKLIVAGLTPQVFWGFLASTLFGIAAIAGLIRFVRTRTYEPFAWYRVIFALVVFLVVVV
jgi:undecaprenyl-diphosphatase